jgi:hypothetical protein
MTIQDAAGVRNSVSPPGGRDEEARIYDLAAYIADSLISEVKDGAFYLDADDIADMLKDESADFAEAVLAEVVDRIGDAVHEAEELVDQLHEQTALAEEALYQLSSE